MSRGWRSASGSRRAGLIALALSLLLPALVACRREAPPDELRLLQTVADPLLRANRIRSTPIHFSLAAGETAGYWARQLGLCRPSAASGSDPDQECEAWNHGDPATASDPQQRQVYRLAYLFGGASARASPQGWISFDRSFFLVHRDDPAALRCVLAHELVHVLRRHAYLSSRRAQEQDLRDRPEVERNRVLATLSQQQELAADRGALLMTAIAGHDPQACIRQLQDAAELDGDHAPEDPESSHPGHARRIEAARLYLRRDLAADLAHWRSSPPPPAAAPRWSWDGRDRLLTVVTRP